MVYKSTSLYTRKVYPNPHEKPTEMHKFNEEGEPVEVYTLRIVGVDEKVCSCPAHQSRCRHILMQPIFDRADTGDDTLYNSITDNGKYVGLLKYSAGQKYNWVRGMEIPEG